MSYILDALRRSDAEREREQAQVPGLFAQQPAGTSLRTAEPASRGLPGWLLIAAGVAFGVAVPAVWFGLLQPEKAVPVAAIPPANRAGVTSAPSQAPSATPLPAPNSIDGSPQPASAPQREVASMTVPAAPKTQPPRTAPSNSAPARAPETPIARTPVAPIATPKAASAPASVAASTTQRVPKLSELPENVRREIPGLAFGGAVYSETPSARFVILNGLIYREQDRVSPDLVVEQIKLKSTVLRWREQRFEIAF